MPKKVELQSGNLGEFAAALADALQKGCRVQITLHLTPNMKADDSKGKSPIQHETIRLEKDLIRQALQETSGNVTHAARRLKISRKSLQNKMKELGIAETT